MYSKKSIRFAKSKYFEKCFDENKNDMKKTWFTINDMLHRNKFKNCIPEAFNHDGNIIKDQSKIAEELNNFFINIGPSIVENMVNENNKHFGQYLTDHYDCRLRFKTITESDTIAIINNIKAKKSCSHDQLSTELLKHIMNPLIPPLTHVINQMINTGIFPDNLKIAKVKPLFKKEINHYSRTTDLYHCYLLYQKCLKKLFSNNSMYILQKMIYSLKVSMVFDLNTRLNSPP